MGGTRPLEACPQFKCNEPWRRARLVQRASPHLGEEHHLWQWGLGIALGGIFVAFIAVLFFVI